MHWEKTWSVKGTGTLSRDYKWKHVGQRTCPLVTFPDPTIADAIMDRVIHNSYVLALDSKKSMREVMAEKIITKITTDS
jgi:hypothetical protein